MWCMVNSVHLLYFWECRVWYVTMWPMSNDNPGLWVSPVDNISQVLSHLFAGGVNYIPCDFQGWKFAPGFLLPLFLSWFWFVFFTLLSYSYEDDSLVGPPCESLNMGGSWDTPFQHKCGGANFSGCVPPTPLSIDFSWVQQVGDNTGQVRDKLGSFFPPFWPQAVILVITESLVVSVLAT